MLFLKDSEDENKGKLMGIGDVFKGYQSSKPKPTLEYTTTEMEKAEKLYWDGSVSQQQEEKWKDKATNDGLQQANQKSQYWEKYKEMCLILILNNKIDKDENMNTTGSNQNKLLCVFVGSTYNQYLDKYTSYKQSSTPTLDMREHLWTVQAKPAPNSSGS